MKIPNYCKIVFRLELKQLLRTQSKGYEYDCTEEKGIIH
jgi:hypothetical protein